MEIKVIRVTPFEGKGGMKGFASVAIVVEESEITINSIAIKESNKEGNKLYCSPPQQLSPKDNKYYDIANIKGQLWWDVSNAVLAAYSGNGTKASTYPENSNQTPKPQQTLAAKKVNPFVQK